MILQKRKKTATTTTTLKQKQPTFASRTKNELVGFAPRNAMVSNDFFAAHNNNSVCILFFFFSSCNFEVFWTHYSSYRKRTRKRERKRERENEIVQNHKIQIDRLSQTKE